MRRSAFILLTLGILWCPLLACGGSPPGVAVGAPVPEFSLASLSGGEVDSRSLEGGAVVLNFWATWCQPCLREIPELKQMAADQRLEVVGIALDEEGAKAVKPFVARHGIDYTVLLGDQEIFQRMGGLTIPYTLVLDRSRQVVNIYRGLVTQADIEQDLRRMEEQGT